MMPLGAVDATPVANGPRLSAGLWIAAGAEIAVAVAVATLLLRTGDTTSATGHDGPGMSDMQPVRSSQYGWHPAILVAGAITSALLIWWLATRMRIVAILGAAGLVIVGTSETVRTMALQSHLIAMAALEALTVAAPLLLIAMRRPGRPADPLRHSRPWTACVVIAVTLNSALLIALHLPSVHRQAAELDMVPLWLALLVVVIGLSYWAAILVTAGLVRPAVRRGALIIGQEVAAILGLAAVLRPSASMHHANTLGLSPTVDQRLGGVLMLVTCAAVTLPLAKRLQRQQGSQQLRTESDVH